MRLAVAIPSEQLECETGKTVGLEMTEWLHSAKVLQLLYLAQGCWSDAKQVEARRVPAGRSKPYHDNKTVLLGKMLLYKITKVNLYITTEDVPSVNTISKTQYIKGEIHLSNNDITITQMMDNTINRYSYL